MFYPTLFKDDLFDDFFNFPSFRDADSIERKLYGKHANGLMKTDVHENEGNYELDIDIPGFKKEEITLTLDNGYLVVGAAKTAMLFRKQMLRQGSRTVFSDLPSLRKKSLNSLKRKPS